MSLPERKLHRLKDWDYSQPGYYFITICTHKKQKLLAEIIQSEAEAHCVLTDIGRIVLDCWQRTPEIYPNVKLDWFCLMPNHLHGILIIDEPDPTGKVSISSIVRGFKSVTTRTCRQLLPQSSENTLWQNSFYDEIIRSDEMLYNIRRYIEGNPFKWAEDTEYVP